MPSAVQRPRSPWRPCRECRRHGRQHRRWPRPRGRRESPSRGPRQQQNDPVDEQRQSEGDAEVVADRGDRTVPRREAEVARGPDTERLEWRDLAEEVAEARAAGVEGLETAGSRSSGRSRGRPGRRRRARPAGPDARDDRRRAPSAASASRPEDRGADQPDQAREAVGVDGRPPPDQSGRDEAKREVAPVRGRRLPQGKDEGEHEEGLHRLLEGALGEVGGDQVGEADEERRRPSAESGAGVRERGQSGEGRREPRPRR